jgi:hypothetical protein
VSLGVGLEIALADGVEMMDAVGAGLTDPAEADGVALGDR